MFVNPTVDAEPETADLMYDRGNVDWFHLRVQAGGEAHGATIDEIRIGTTYADVVPVPEPSTIGLLAFVGASLGMIRRFRS